MVLSNDVFPFRCSERETAKETGTLVLDLCRTCYHRKFGKITKSLMHALCSTLRCRRSPLTWCGGDEKKICNGRNDRKVVFICTFCLKGADCLQIDDGAYGRCPVSLTCCRPSSPCERRGPRGGSSSPIRCRTTTRA